MRDGPRRADAEDRVQRHDRQRNQEGEANGGDAMRRAKRVPIRTQAETKSLVKHHTDGEQEEDKHERK